MAGKRTPVLVTAPVDSEADDRVRLLERVAEQQDQDAFSVMFRHFYPRLVNFMTVAGFSVREGEELAQEAMLKVWLNAGSYRSERGSVNAWIFAIARNVRCDGLRKRRGTVQLDDELEIPAEGPGQNVIAVVEARQVMDSLQSLSPEQGKVLTLTYLQGLTQVEISERLKIPLGTVKSRVRLAMGNLRAKLGLD